MWPNQVSNPGPQTYESGALPTALRGPAIKYCNKLSVVNIEIIKKFTPEELDSAMTQMAHFSSPYYFTIPNSEFRIQNSEICTTNFGIRNCEVYVVWASGNSLSTLEGILNS